MNAINIMQRLCFILLTFLVVSCASQRPVPELQTNISQELIEQHQQQVNRIKQWRLQGRIAFFDDINRDRTAANMVWETELEPEQNSMFRLYHPLKGTIARLHSNKLSASLELDGETYRAQNVEQLLSFYLKLPIPFDLILNAMTSAIPNSEHISDVTYFNDGTPASYRYESERNEQNWLVSFYDYRVHEEATENVKLPETIELESSGQRIKLQINRWTLNRD